MAIVLDPHGTAWSVHRVWWPFPGDLLDFTDLFEIVIGLLSVLLWPFWLLTKFLGARWVIVIERDGHRVGRELVRWSGPAKRRVNDLLLEIGQGKVHGAGSAQFLI
ncbi:hypothetical protein [Mycobacterium sp. URHB0044]|uniref:hypothetical protein n=1 Tax=Mycobacterium sp. URHB0044 TaxID=1380386 RepID=UPI0007E8E3CB|nr:hypothetical protein [Mycobacterium sp. URHB0044]